MTTGLKMLDFMKGNATMEDVIRQLDEDQDSVVNNTPDTITTVTEELSQETAPCWWAAALHRLPAATLRWCR